MKIEAFMKTPVLCSGADGLHVVVNYTCPLFLLIDFN